MEYKISPSAREHLIRIRQDSGLSPEAADAYLAKILEVLQGSDDMLPTKHVCGDLAESIRLVRIHDHVIFLRPLDSEVLGIVAVLHASACTSMNLECRHARCLTLLVLNDT